MTLENRPSFTVKMALSDRNGGTCGPQLKLGSAQGQVGAACNTTGRGLVCGLSSSWCAVTPRLGPSQKTADPREKQFERKQTRPPA